MGREPAMDALAREVYRVLNCALFYIRNRAALHLRNQTIPAGIDPAWDIFYGWPDIPFRKFNNSSLEER
jgi:hypothetical protein